MHHLQQFICHPSRWHRRVERWWLLLCEILDPLHLHVFEFLLFQLLLSASS